MRSDNMNAEASAQHLEMLLEANPDVPIILFWDRAPWHRGKSIDKVLEENPRLEIIFFPKFILGQVWLQCYLSDVY